MKLRRVARVVLQLVLSISLLVYAGSAYAQTEPGGHSPLKVTEHNIQLVEGVTGQDEGTFSVSLSDHPDLPDIPDLPSNETLTVTVDSEDVDAVTVNATLADNSTIVIGKTAKPSR